MASKMIVFVGLLLAIVLVSSQVAARELAATSKTVDESSKEAEKTDGALVDDSKNPESHGENLGRGGYNDGYGGGGHYGGGGGHYGGGGGHYGGGGGHYGGGGGHYGGGGGHYGGGGGCHKCCGYHGCHCCTAGEKPDAEPQAEPHN